jgi:hypothetical protein
MMRTLALVLISCTLLSATASAAPLAQTRPQESAADAAARKARAKQEAEQQAAKRLAESKRKRQTAREEARGKPGDAPVQSDKPAKPRRDDAPAKPRRDAPSDKIRGGTPDRDRVSDRPGDAAPEPTANAELRRLRREVLVLERNHRERSARINRLAVVFREQGKTEKVQQLELMEERENLRYERALGGYRREMGPEAFAKLEAALEAGRGQPGKAVGPPQSGDRPGDRPPARAGGRADGNKQDQGRTDRPRSDKPRSDKPARRNASGGGRGSV